MSRLVHIPETINEIEKLIEYKKEQLAWWLDKLNRTRKNALINHRSLQVGVVREQIEILEQALEDAFDEIASGARCDEAQLYMNGTLYDS